MCSCKYLGNGKVHFENYRDYYKDIKIRKNNNIDNTNKEGGTDEKDI